MAKQVRINETLGVEIASGGPPRLRIVREGAGIVSVRLAEVPALVNALSELAARAALEAGDEFQDNLW